MGRASFHTTRMKANPRSRVLRLPLIAVTAATTAMLGACVPPPPVATPGPVATAPTPRPRPPAPAPAPIANWRDAPATAGSWTYSGGSGGSSASFGGGHFAVHCDPAARAVTLVRAATLRPGAATIAITTSTTSRSLNATSTPRGLVATLPARDPLLDAMAFSNGRFMVQSQGYAPLYLPSWTEVSRVIEDCR